MLYLKTSVKNGIISLYPLNPDEMYYKSMLQLSIMIEQQKQQSSSLQRFKTRCIMRFMDIQQRS